MIDWIALWYERHPRANLPWRPLASVYCLAVRVRRSWWRRHVPRPLSVPVIVVGNLTVGGTGKTPLVIRLLEVLREAGWRPGAISRGYGGRARDWPQWVEADSDPKVVGDEPVLIARRSGCPMVVGPNRVAAAMALLQAGHCDCLVADDGLQHYRLPRTVEIVVVDGQRQFGNGWCLPAGPLREPLTRLQDVDWVVSNGATMAGAIPMTLEGREVIDLTNSSHRQPLSVWRGQVVHAVAGIGNPGRFFATLAEAGLRTKRHPFPDHHRYRPNDLCFNDQIPLIMTEKDAVKCHQFALANAWYLPVTAVLPPAFELALLAALERYADGQTFT